MSSPLRSECPEHGAGETWVVCIHIYQIRFARLVSDQPLIVGDALCDACRVMVDGGSPPTSSLRIACGGCVRARYPLEVPS